MYGLRDIRKETECEHAPVCARAIYGASSAHDTLGLTIETVSRQLTGMRGIGLIDPPGSRGMAINDGEALETMAEAA